MSDPTPIPFSQPGPREPVTEIEIQRLSRWASRSTLPAWPTFDPSVRFTPPDTIARVIGEWHAMKAVLDLVGEFAGDLGQLLKRMEGGQ